MIYFRHAANVFIQSSVDKTDIEQRPLLANLSWYMMISRVFRLGVSWNLGKLATVGLHVMLWNFKGIRNAELEIFTILLILSGPPKLKSRNIYSQIQWNWNQVVQDRMSRFEPDIRQLALGIQVWQQHPNLDATVLSWLELKLYRRGFWWVWWWQHQRHMQWHWVTLIEWLADWQIDQITGKSIDGYSLTEWLTIIAS